MLENELKHYGIQRRSGRYPWGSGGNVELKDSKSFLDYIKQMLGMGLTEAEVARGIGITTSELRAAKTIARNEQRAADIAFAQRLKDKGYSNVAIGERMGLNESSVRGLLAPGAQDRVDVLRATTNMLRDQVDSKKFVDVGSGVENNLGLSKEKLASAVAILKAEGYEVLPVKLEQLGTGKMTEYKILAPPGTTQKDVWLNRADIKQIDMVWTDDGGRTFQAVRPPKSIDSSRVAINYAETGGKDADGVLYIRPGVDDISLGGKHYAQVRVAVDGTHYIKGMAIYKDDLPDGVDILFNTNKSDTGNKFDALKPMERDKDGNIIADNPFGSTIRRQVDIMNIVNEEGAWGNWSDSLSSQMLSKQDLRLVKQQLDVLRERRLSDYDEISALTNPAVKRKMLIEFADGLDASAVQLEAAALPRQANQVILPVPKMKETEVYAPNFRNGEKVVLIRHPHGGTFEIPELTVNNRQPDAKKLLGNAADAIGINPKVAERLSGADFDGDTVIVIPNNKGEVKTSAPLKGLQGFDPQRAYPAYQGMKRLSPEGKQQQMGLVSNLITDMTIMGATPNEIARAVRHSMVVIDAEKHNLNYKQSAIDNGIPQLKEKYLGKSNAGASTLISRATSPLRVPELKERPLSEGGPIDKATGKRVYVPTNRTMVDRDGNVVPRSTKVKRLALEEDARNLSSGTRVESIYADHSNQLKALANKARKEAVNLKNTPYSPSARSAYNNEVASLNSKLNVALKNRPLERQAQVIANATLAAKRRANPGMTPDEVKKVKYQALTEARIRTQAKKQRIQITPREWDAIQAGAITSNKLSEILSNTDPEVIKQLATPKTPRLMTSTKLNRAKSMAASGYTQAEIADALGVSLTTLKNGLSGEDNG